jgi:hypothetical protein
VERDLFHSFIIFGITGGFQHICRILKSYLKAETNLLKRGK